MDEHELQYRAFCQLTQEMQPQQRMQQMQQMQQMQRMQPTQVLHVLVNHKYSSPFRLGGCAPQISASICQSLVSGLRSSAVGLGSSVFCRWPAVIGLRSLIFRIRSLAFGIWSLASSISAFGLWSLVFGHLPLVFGHRSFVFMGKVSSVWEGERCGGMWRRQVANAEAPRPPGHSVVLACIEAEQ